VCSFVYQDHSIDIVLEKGRIFLASTESLTGDEAIPVLTSLLDKPVEAIISDLTPSQLRLSREFNENCIVHHPLVPSKDIPSLPHDVEERTTDTENLPSNTQESSIQSDFPSNPAEDSLTRNGKPAPQRELPIEPVLSESTDNHDLASLDEVYTLTDQDLSALDSMDLDTMTKKIRENCKSIVERLQLGHLVVDDDKKESE